MAQEHQRLVGNSIVPSDFSYLKDETNHSRFERAVGIFMGALVDRWVEPVVLFEE